MQSDDGQRERCVVVDAMDATRLIYPEALSEAGLLGIEELEGSPGPRLMEGEVVWWSNTCDGGE